MLTASSSRPGVPAPLTTSHSVWSGGRFFFLGKGFIALIRFSEWLGTHSVDRQKGVEERIMTNPGLENPKVCRNRPSASDWRGQGLSERVGFLVGCWKSLCGCGQGIA